MHFQYLIKSTMSYKEALCRVAADSLGADLECLSSIRQARLSCYVQEVRGSKRKLTRDFQLKLGSSSSWIAFDDEWRKEDLA